ncbi:MAG TPA: hypothetical protein VK659_01355 [Asanoa sp.]|nr:hypothetical protein [Asanoa sp.]
MRRSAVLLAVLMAMLAGGCSGEKEARACALPTNGEMQGTGTLWALFFSTADQPAPVVADQEAKIVWKIGGTGAFTVKATGPEGAEANPVWGPEGHGGSSWARPGSEYGTGFRLPAPGCWTFTAQRESGEKGELWLTVA